MTKCDITLKTPAKNITINDGDGKIIFDNADKHVQELIDASLTKKADLKHSHGKSDLPSDIVYVDSSTNQINPDLLPDYVETLPVSSKTEKGVVKIGYGINVNNGEISVNDVMATNFININNWNKIEIYDLEYISACCYGNGVFIIGNKDSNIIYSSSDCINWSPIALPNGCALSDLYYLNGKFLGYNNKGKGVISYDGENWNHLIPHLTYHVVG